MNQFYEYMIQFESRVILEGVKKNCLGKVEKIPLRSGKLTKQRFGKFMGTVLSTPQVCVIDYYGLLKKSSGFWDLASETRKNFSGKQVKSIEVPVVHFASVRIEKVATLAPDLVTWFPIFKKRILDARGFHHGYGE